MNLRELDAVNLFEHREARELYSDRPISTRSGELVIPPLGFYWLQL